ncbi:dehydrase and lipid transport-domain-containing protein [Flagelloscypha sp. PMI_526]|nr:dehydrase and lipid transport-domain-containing protein [Flagelloscypha sp. PMI_526]
MIHCARWRLHSILPHNRHLFTFPSSAPRVFREQKVLPYTREQLYAVVSDVPSYPTFIPHCTSCRVLKSSTHPISNVKEMEAELTVGFLAFTESYVSNVTCIPNESVKAVATSSTPLFTSLTTLWKFKSSLPSQQQSPTVVSLDLEYAFANPLHATVSDKFFGKVSKLMVTAFEERCEKIYGTGQK